MARLKMFGRSLTGHGASLAEVGGIVAERNRVAAEVDALEQQLAAAVFAYLPRWPAVRRALANGGAP